MLLQEFIPLNLVLLEKLVFIFHSPQVHLHLIRSEHFNSEHYRRSFFRLEYAALIRRDVQHAVVTSRVPHEGQVDAGRKMLVNLYDFVLQKLKFDSFRNVLHLSQHLRYFRQTLYELGCG